MEVSRREILGATAAAGAAVIAARSGFGNEPATQLRIVDSNVSLFDWPFRRLPLGETSRLVKKLKSLGISQAWAGSFESLLHRDVAAVNQRLRDECSKHAILVPIGAVNPDVVGWEQELRTCVRIHKMPGIRLFPNYHGYTLDSPRFAQLLKQATDFGVFIQIAATMEDPRTQHPQVVVDDVDLSPLERTLPQVPDARVQILNHRLRPAQASELARCGRVFFDTARVDSTDGVPQLVKAMPEGRVLHGSHAPFLIPEASLIRSHESGILNSQQLEAVLSKNADTLSQGAKR